MGAILHADTTTHRVHAPSTHALPIIRCVSDPFGSTDRQTEIELTTYENGIHRLRHVSTRLGGIWDENHTQIEGPTHGAQSKARSFAPVSLMPCCQYLGSIDTLEDIPLLSTSFQQTSEAFTSIRTVGISTREVLDR